MATADEATSPGQTVGFLELRTSPQANTNNRPYANSNKIVFHSLSAESAICCDKRWPIRLNVAFQPPTPIAPF